MASSKKHHASTCTVFIHFLKVQDTCIILQTVQAQIRQLFKVECNNLNNRNSADYNMQLMNFVEVNIKFIDLQLEY